MRDNLFHASTAESIGSRHTETYLRKMRSTNAGGANATTAGLNLSIPEESGSLDLPLPSLSLSLSLSLWVFRLPPAIFHPINRDERRWRKAVAAPFLAEARTVQFVA